MMPRGGDAEPAAITPGPETAPVPTVTERGPPPPPGAISAVGFRAELSGASLWDLVQMECLGRSRQVVRVSGEGGVGYLYFSGGRIIHAVTARFSGQAAALDILTWTHGAFQPCERSWPTAATIEVSHEALLLLAAKRRDEAAASNLVVFRGRSDVDPRGTSDGSAIELREIHETEEVEMAEMRKPNDSPVQDAASIARNEALPDFSMMIRVNAAGTIVKSKSGTDEIAGVVAYTHRLVELVGELLGLERFMAMECTFKDPQGTALPGQSRCLLFTEANGDTVALRPRPESDIQPLRESLGL
jgi:Domain of unknown function (DUF4388)